MSLFEGITCNDEDHQVLFSPVKLGGMGKTNLTSISDKEYQKLKKNKKNLLTAATIKKRLNLQINFMAAFIVNSKNRTT